MTRGKLAKILGGLTLVGPLAIPAWAGEKPGHVNVLISKIEEMVTQVTGQERAPEQAKPATTESKDAAPAAANGNCNGEAEETPGFLMQHLSCGPLGSWLECNRVKASGHVAMGYTWNPDSPHDRLNFGRLFDDRSNDFRFNQALVTLERALDPQACCPDWGFKASLMYGSDARFIEVIGFMDNVTNDTVQPDIVELYGSYHAPILTDGGVDFKVGQFATLHGVESMYAPNNVLYSHSYYFNFAPFKHTGILATTHVSDSLDIHAGIVAGTGVGTFDDNNDDQAFHGGFTWKRCDWVVNGVVTWGPENDSVFDGAGADVSNDDRQVIELNATYTPSECVTLMSDIYYLKDEGFGGVEAYGIAQYFIYTVNKCTKLVVRGEIFRDDDAFFVAKFGENDDLIDIVGGRLGGLDPDTASGGDTTYTSLTVGLNVTPYENLLIRPEVRWDWADVGSLGVAPFDDLSDNNQFTLGLDVILSF
jgi:hypothetical protein